MRRANGRDRNRCRGLAATLLALGLFCACRSGSVGSPATPPASASIAASAPSGPPGLLSGTLVDSLLTSDVLRGALLALDGVLRVTTTSDKGEFQFDSVTPGAHHLVVRHPLLDSLGIDTIGVDLRLGATPNQLTVALPTAAAYMATRCGPPGKRVTDGMLLGVVRRAETDQPVADIEVAAAWRSSDTTFAGGGLRERARVRTDRDGRFLICKVPRFSAVEAWVRNDGRETPRMRVQLGASVFAAYDFSIESAIAARDTAVPAIEATGGTISGRILTLSGDGLPNVQVQLDRPDAKAMTDAVGRFSFRNVPAGVRALDIRALGFRPSRVGINLRPSQRIERDITLDRTVAVLGAVTVRAARRITWDSVGFDERQRKGSGYFFGREALKGITDLATALRLVPGIQGRSTDRSQRLIAGRGAGCYPAFVVNGVRFEAGGNIGPEALLRAEDVRAMEVYTSRLSTPPEHQRYADCAVVVIWLRDIQGEIEARKPKPPVTPPARPE
jgi:hypothetical protein